MQKLYIASKYFEQIEESNKHSICGIQPSFLLNTDVPDLENQAMQRIPPFLQYIYYNWTHHIQDISYSQELCAQLWTFAHNYLLF